MNAPACTSRPLPFGHVSVDGRTQPSRSCVSIDPSVHVPSPPPSAPNPRSVSVVLSRPFSPLLSRFVFRSRGCLCLPVTLEHPILAIRFAYRHCCSYTAMHPFSLSVSDCESPSRLLSCALPSGAARRLFR